MSAQFEVKKDEHGVIRLFTIAPDTDLQEFSNPPDDAEQNTPPLCGALGVAHLNTDFIELFPVSDLQGLGLAGYMTQGLGIAEAEVAVFKPQLDAITGHVLIVFSKAFDGTQTTITPRAPLKWIGTFVEETAPVQFEPLPSKAAEGAVNTHTKASPSDAAMSGRVATVVLILLGVLVWLLIWIAS